MPTITRRPSFALALEHDAPPAGMGVAELDYLLSPRVARGASGGAYERKAGDPLVRPIRVFALDPSASVLEGAAAVASVPFEPLTPGPVGRLVRVVDDGYGAEPPRDPLDLDEHRLLVSQGCTPSVTDPAFRAQMAYAVCSLVHATFRRALGREVPWGFERGGGPDANRLVVRSCVSDARNAWYDPERGELRLGAFEADDTVEGRNVGRGRVATALIHDVVVHEVSHALLDGLRARFTHPSNPDVLAFHEAFADLVAIFLRFTYRDVVRAAIEGTRGELGQVSVLTEVGRQFAQTAGFGSALRSAALDPSKADREAAEPHRRGEVLAAAVFRAFTTVYQRKALPLLRLATNGTGVLPEGRISELLAEQLAHLATRLSSHFLSICIRAIDYCPPVDITFGEYLRAVVTADMDLVADDPWAYREAWVDAFRAYGIRPRGVVGLTQDALRWDAPDIALPVLSRLSFRELRFNGDPGRPADAQELTEQGHALGALVGDPRYREAFGLARPGQPELEGDEVDPPLVESVRTSRRVGPDGQVVFDVVAEVTQRRRVQARDGAPVFDFFGGATLLLDPHGRVRYLVRKSVLHPERLAAQRAFVRGDGSRWFLAAAGETAVPRPNGLRLLHEEGRG
jgi:hypothetical protein